MPEENYRRVPSFVNVIPLICLKCGASLADLAEAIHDHDEWHAKMDELIDWAQAVSKLFTSPQEVDSEAPSIEL